MPSKAPEQHVGVRVNEPGQQATAGHRQHRPAIRRGPPYADDHLVLHEHHLAISPSTGPRIEDPAAGQG
jgi:hypothetical protein